MRSVLVYTPRVLPGSQTFIADQARSLKKWHPTLVGREAVPGGIDVQELLPAGVLLPDSSSVRQRMTRRIPTLRRAFSETDPDLVHAHFLTGGIDVVATLPSMSCPLIVTAHGFDATCYGSPPSTYRPHQWLLGLLRRRLLRRPIVFLAVSRFIRDQLVNLGADAESVIVHHIGVDTAFFSPPAASELRSGVLFVGRLVPKKGLEDLLQALRVLASRGIDPGLTVIGDGPERGRLERRARQYGLSVAFLGQQNRAEVRSAMHAARVLCGPSRTHSSGDREGFGMVFLEAQAVGLPVVATDSGGIPDAVADDQTGLLVPEAKPAMLAEALGRCLTDVGLHARLSEAGPLRVAREFNLATQTASLEALYDKLTGGAGSTRRWSPDRVGEGA